MPPKKTKNASAAPSASTPNRPKKRKAGEERIAEENERIKLYAQGLEQAKLEKKQHPLVGSLNHAPKTSTRRLNRPPTSPPVGKPGSSAARRKVVPPMKTSERIPPIEEEQVEEETAPPPAKRRRTNPANESDSSIEAARKRAQQWFKETYGAPSKVTNVPSSPRLSEVYTLVDPPTPAPSSIESAQERAAQWATATYGVPSKLNNAASANQSLVSTNPPARISSPARRNISAVSSTRFDGQASSSQFVPPPPSRQKLRKPVPTKAPFGSPIPTLNASTVASYRSPAPVMPTVQELEAPTRNVLSPKPRESVHLRQEPTPVHSYLRQEPAPVHSFNRVREPEYSNVIEDALEEPWRPKGPPLYKIETGIAILAFFGVLFVSVLIAVLFDPSTQFDGWNSLLLNGTTAPVLLSCFDDYPVRSNLEIEEELLVGGGTPSKCLMDDANPTKPCPEGGHCSGGHLKHCYDAIFQASTDGLECTFTTVAQRQREALRDLLTKYTVQHVCSVPQSPNPFYIKGSHNPPLFDYRALIDVLQIPYHPKLISHRTKIEENHPIFLLEQSEKDGSFFIGLHPSQVVDLPLSCWTKRILTSAMNSLLAGAGSLSVPLKQLVTSVISYLMVLVWTLLIALTSWIYSSFIASPLVSMAMTVFVLFSITLIYHFDQQRRFIREVEADVVQVREYVYQELSRDPKPEVQPELIRERIAWMLYPRSHGQRERLRKVVFPFVMRDIATDDRIRKSYSGAPPQLFWKWVDPHPYRSASH
jgi:hypothetical protein